jgi:glutamate racemase
LIEEGLLDDDAPTGSLSVIEAPACRRIDTLVLGCTHYPLLSAASHARSGKSHSSIPQNCATAVQETLDRQSLRSPATERGELHVALTDAADNFLNVARDALQLSFGEIELRSLS